MLYKLPKPDLTNINFLKIQKLLESNKIAEYLEATMNPAYLYWDKVKYKKRPDELSAEEFWYLVKISRSLTPTKQNTPVIDSNGENFTLITLNRFLEFLTEFDKVARSSQVEFYSLTEHDKNYIIKNGFIDEAISSSQIEGANTTRRAAKKMILEGMKPKNTSEQMIINNYDAIKLIENELCFEKLDDNLMHRLHSTLTKNTLDKKDIGRYRTDLDQIIVSGVTDETVYHIPPLEEKLKKDLIELFKYANNSNDKTHPVIKSIILHFWIGYLHPYVDGNGRLARALFYWHLLKNRYVLIGCFPLSSIIKKSRGQYRDAYVLSEQDDLDLTYFIDYNLKKLEQSLKDFNQFVRKLKDDLKKISKLDLGYNQRQFQLIKHLYSKRNDSVTIKSYTNQYSITRMTARKDLKDLENHGLLSTKKIGLYVHYFATEKLFELFEKFK